MLADEFLPVYDVSDAVAVTVQADAATTWRSLLEADLIEVGRRKPLVGVLGATRMLPELVSHALHGEPLPERPARVTLRGTTEMPATGGGWVLLREDEAAGEIALGLVGKFWRPVIQYAAVTAESFRDFSAPGYAKTAYVLGVQPLDDGRTLLTGLMRTATTDEHARAWFRRYWTFGVGSGAHVLVQGLLEVVRDAAEDGGGAGA
jgi:hypothetical protein